GPDGKPELSSRQFGFAREPHLFKDAARGEQIWLYVVEFAETAPRITRLNDPVAQATKYVFDPGWRAAGEKDPVGLEAIVEAMREAGLPGPQTRYVAEDDPDAALDLAWLEHRLAVVADAIVAAPSGWTIWSADNIDLDALIDALRSRTNGAGH